MLKERLFVIIIGIVLVLSSCGNKGVDNQESSGYSTVSGESETDEQESEIEAFWRDAQEDSITHVFYQYYWANDAGLGTKKGNVYFTLDDCREQLKPLESSNRFAKQFNDLVSKIDTSDLNYWEKKVFETYFQLLFYYYEIEYDDNLTPLGKVTEVWIHETIDKYSSETNQIFHEVYMRVEDLFGYDVPKDDYVYVKDYVYQDISSNDKTDYTEIRDGHMSVGSSIKDYGFKSLDLTKVNNKIDENAELVQLLQKYRQKVFAPWVRGIHAEHIADVKEKVEQKESDQKLKQSEPKIGMSADEVRKCKWGEPTRINKDVYSWGVYEQWVYDGYGYVYLEDGVVTSISYR